MVDKLLIVRIWPYNKQLSHMAICEGVYNAWPLSEHTTTTKKNVKFKNIKRPHRTTYH